MEDIWHPPHRLYHGTSGTAARKALTEGIQPRRITHKSNWDTFESHPDYVYLTDAYAPFYANRATKYPRKLGIVEVDVDRLNWDKLRPEEDAVEQMTRGITDWKVVNDPQLRSVLSKIPNTNMVERTRFVRDHLDRLHSMWGASLRLLGTCAYHGFIPREAITRVSIFDPKSNPWVVMTTMDPSITLMNYRVLAEKYRFFTRWFFEPVSAEEWLAHAEFPGVAEAMGDRWNGYFASRKEALAKRDGLEVIDAW